MSTDHPPVQVSVPIYWAMPGPTSFLVKLGHMLEAHSAGTVCLARGAVAGAQHVINDAFKRACHETERVVFLDVHEGSHIESDVGHHFARGKLSAMELAHWSQPPRVTVVLTPLSVRASDRCRGFFEEFAKESAALSAGAVRLVVVWSLLADPLPPKSRCELRFDGTLSEDEMHAYVTQRLVGRRGPGSTSLARHLVIEFAGADPLVAEELMALHPNALLQLPESLASMPQRDASCDRASGALKDWLEVRAQAAGSAVAWKRLEQRYWRACVRALLPWIEERRLPVIDKLRDSLEDYLFPTKGVWKKFLPWRPGSFQDIAIDDLEFNDMVAMSHRDAADPFKGLDETANAALTACFKVKKVRDAIAHMRPPAAADIGEMILALDALLTQDGAGSV